jgi:uncharacterized membrane protein YphA (DoxX/SURF4 family)
MDIVRIILSIVLGLMLLATGGGKVLDLPFSRGNRVALKVHPVFWRITGVLEVAATVGLIWGIWFVPFGLAAATGVALLMIGAFGFRLRTRDRNVVKQGLADIAVFVLDLVVILLSILNIVR